MSDSQQICVDRLKVLADSTRLAVMRTLMASGPQHVNELEVILGVEQSLLSHHLRVLRDAGLVVGERDGKAVLYRLDPGVELLRGEAAINLGCCKLAFDEEDA